MEDYKLRIAYAGDRDIAVKVLRFILDQNVKPLVLMVPDEEKSTHTENLAALCPHLNDKKILRGNEFKSEYGKDLLKKLNLDYIISIHFPYIYPKEILEIPKHGVLNLHPAYLPYNKGWHTPTWAIWDNTPYGATLHFMNEKIDSGNIVHQKILEVYPHDVADTLYKRVEYLELEVFKEAWPILRSFTYKSKPQHFEGTFHRKEDIKKLQYIDLGQDLIRRLRALTTNKVEEAAFFEINGKRYRIQIHVYPEKYTSGNKKR